ncbi:MAG: glutaredoxin family protein [Waddliaceae bacterium]
MLKKLPLISPVIFLAVSFLLTSAFAAPLLGANSYARQTNTGTETTSVVLYYNPSCSHCKKVLGYLNSRNKSIPMKNTSNPQYRQELRSLGHKGVPVLSVGTRTITGADAIINYLMQHEELLN